MAKPMYDIIFRNCNHCNKEFMIEHPRQLYCCEECKKEHKKTNKKTGVRQTPKPRSTPVRNQEWMTKQLEGTGISMIGPYRGLVTGVEFQCANGHVFKKSPGVVAHGKSCPLCGMEKKETDIWNWNRKQHK